jgi:regulator of protease activity HflC (stomatin/prohibitin superfamily)
VKWVREKHIKALGPGWHLYWPLTTEVEVVVTARQTLAIPDQVMASKDGKKVVVKTLVVYHIPDVVRAIGKVNWDVDTAINDLTRSAVARVIATHTYDEIMKGLQDESLTQKLTKETRRELQKSLCRSLVLAFCAARLPAPRAWVPDACRTASARCLMPESSGARSKSPCDSQVMWQWY